jgi:hypothetical protein
MTTCDNCGKDFPVIDRHVNAHPRPSNPQELTATLWFCPSCGEKSGLPSADDVLNAIDESDGMWKGDRYMWVTI